MTALIPSLSVEERKEDHFVRLSGASWGDYERVLSLRGERSAPRIAFCEGELELMSPSRSHEALKSVIRRLVEDYCLARDLEFSTYGSWTLQSQAQGRGVEPDECFAFGAAASSPEVPDLAVEVVWTAGGLDKLDIYRVLGVREVWVWRRGALQAFALGSDGYLPVAESHVLSGIDLQELAACMEEPTTSAAIRRFRKSFAPQR